MVVPTLRVVTPLVLVTARSAVGIGGADTVSLSLAVLFAAEGSVVPVGATSVTVLVNGEVAVEEIVAGTVKVAVPPDSRLTSTDRSPLPDAGQDEPGEAIQVHVAKVRPVGAVSFTVAPVTGLGPALVATMV